ncbi:MAG: TldD/PmbA family protein [Ignavibacteriae bacterium]|nr:TldD/PmbA family protein [Ignavibacteriota bacterium]
MKNISIKDKAEWAVEYALKSGASEATANVNEVKSLEIILVNDGIEKLQESNQKSLGIELYCNNRYSSHSTNDMREDSLKRFIEEAVKMTNYLAKDEARSLPEKKLYPDKDILNRNLELNDSSFSSLDFKSKLGLLQNVYDTIKGKSDKVINVTSYYSDSLAKGVLVHSKGFSGETESTGYSLYAIVSANDPNGGKPSSGEGCSVRHLKDMMNPSEIAKKALERTLGRIGQKKIESGVYKMLVENRSGWSPMGTLLRALGGRTLQQKNSYLEGMLGKNIASEKLTVTDNPFVKKGLGSRHFDSEGLAAQQREIITNGILNAYYINDYYGKKMSMTPFTGSSSNLIYKCGDRTIEELVKTIDKGILVTEFLGGNFNSTTGDFSNGIAGFYIENGEIKYPVNEMNISGNAKDLWAKLIEVGNDPYVYSSNQTPSFLFDKIDFSGI